MKYVILDTSFIISCVQKKIDFFEEISLMGIKIIVPEEVIREIKHLADSKKKLRFKDAAILALKILENNSFKKIKLGGKIVDNSIISVANKEGYLVATLDKEIKSKTINQKLVIRGQKKLEVI